jgi:hypothetical protein
MSIEDNNLMKWKKMRREKEEKVKLLVVMFPICLIEFILHPFSFKRKKRSPGQMDSSIKLKKGG